MTLVGALVIACSVAHPADGPPALALPIACEVGTDCWISNRPDDDPGPGIRDHTGGSSTYDGHNGTDVAVRDVGQAEATWVIAPAAGRVLRVRDGEPDGELLAGGEDAVDDKECGNGMVIDVGVGWELQLCHLLWGTVAVAEGQQVDTGAKLGRVGWSGEADHPHVHVVVRHEGRVVDPFSGAYLDDATPAADGPLWATTLPAPTDMDALVWAGFDAGPQPADGMWPIDGGRGVVPTSATSLVLGMYLWRPQEGDVVRTEIQRPDGTTTRSEVVQPRDRPRQTWYVEKTWDGAERPVGLWTARVVWQRGDRTREIRTSALLK